MRLSLGAVHIYPPLILIGEAPVLSLPKRGGVPWVFAPVLPPSLLAGQQGQGRRTPIRLARAPLAQHPVATLSTATAATSPPRATANTSPPLATTSTNPPHTHTRSKEQKRPKKGHLRGHMAGAQRTGGRGPPARVRHIVFFGSHICPSPGVCVFFNSRSRDGMPETQSISGSRAPARALGVTTDNREELARAPLGRA
jgi:hypothetical protein